MYGLLAFGLSRWKATAAERSNTVLDISAEGTDIDCCNVFFNMISHPGRKLKYGVKEEKNDIER